ncbi:hypothetical protein DFJ73DRAFT_853001 [Zopfochytrium polystomum]|nr:hypothetical protein DFJ73DRAFT_853001 [Zopfochytrium polystomum]
MPRTSPSSAAAAAAAAVASASASASSASSSSSSSFASPSTALPAFLARSTSAATHLRPRSFLPAPPPTPAAPYTRLQTFYQTVVHSDGSTFTLRTTTPRALQKLTKDARNHALWNPLLSVVDDRAGELSKFRQRFLEGDGGLVDLSVLEQMEQLSPEAVKAAEAAAKKRAEKEKRAQEAAAAAGGTAAGGGSGGAKKGKKK